MLIEKDLYSFKSNIDLSPLKEYKFTPKGSSNVVKYYKYNGKKFNSISKILYNIKEEFDEVKMSIKCSKNPKHKLYGIEPIEIRKIWNDSKIKSRKIGELMDDYIQSKLLNTNIIFKDLNILNNRNQHFNLFREKIIDKYNLKLVSYEDSIFDFEYLIWGRYDAMFLWDGYLVLFDWKSNSEIDKESYFKLLPPFDNIDNCKYNEYTLQLFLYKWILERNYDLKYPIKGCRIAHFNSKKYELLKPSFDYDPNFIEEIVKVSCKRINS